MKENTLHLRRQMAQTAARMMVEDGIHDFAHAKKKAGKELGVHENSLLPSNLEIEHEIRIHHSLYHADTQAEDLHHLREVALSTMRLFAKFNPHLTGSVLDGTAGKGSLTEIHLFADSAKEVEIFLLNQQIPFESSEKSHRISDKPSKDKKEKPHKTVPVYTLETSFGLQKLSVFDVDDRRTPIRKASEGGSAQRMDINALSALLQREL